MLRTLAGVALVVAGVLLPTSAAGGDLPQLDAGVTREESLGRWPGVAPLVCVQDETAGFPVREAAADFRDLPVRLVVKDDCTHHGNVVRVVTRMAEDCCYSAWFKGERMEHDPELFASATIWLNVDQAYRHTPESWAAAIRHELGHAAGLGHGDGTTVMHPTGYTEVGHLTEGDRQAIADIYERSRAE
ncbi:hypothetical protein CLV30_106104 [Haloactinopolyspora alba]|uniref:Matrixin n=1 Tax=Haloactinopolyspora alba TaxID=648780 RepID=A0A2P8E3R4_9ACTN|nr:hypothetical protein [Haloactinopolyspora alba]PSL04101.1 hypothetical protein CLV30_106104 [Haloactinopolyspora alba]